MIFYLHLVLIGEKTSSKRIPELEMKIKKSNKSVTPNKNIMTVPYVCNEEFRRPMHNNPNEMELK